MCNKLGSSTLRWGGGGGEKRNEFVIVPTLLSMVVVFDIIPPICSKNVRQKIESSLVIIKIEKVEIHLTRCNCFYGKAVSFFFLKQCPKDKNKVAQSDPKHTDLLL